MNFTRLSRNAMTGQRVRERIRRSGMTMNGFHVWTSEEDAIVTSKYPNYDAIQKALPHRSYRACLGRARTLGVVQRRPLYSGRDLKIIRKLYPLRARDEILELLPGRTWPQIKQFAIRHNILQIPPAPKETGIVIIDQIKQRCRELGYSMYDLDRLAKTKQYFQKAGWLAGRINHRAIGRAVMVLFGDLKADWK